MEGELASFAPSDNQAAVERLADGFGFRVDMQLVIQVETELRRVFRSIARRRNLDVGARKMTGSLRASAAGGGERAADLQIRTHGPPHNWRLVVADGEHQHFRRGHRSRTSRGTLSASRSSLANRMNMRPRHRYVNDDVGAAAGAV